MYALVFPFPDLLKPHSPQSTPLTIVDLQKAYADYDAGTISHEELNAAQDKAAEDSVLKMAETGETLLTDGEQRSSSFATYPIIDTLGGKGLASNLAADGQYFVSSFARIRGKADINVIGNLRRWPSPPTAKTDKRATEV